MRAALAPPSPALHWRARAIFVGDAALVPDPSGALLHLGRSTLLVADLHLEKGSSLAARGVLLPPWDSAATLIRLGEIIERWTPRRIVALGDSFHDRDGAARLSAQDGARLAALQRGRDWIWISGNHDSTPPLSCGGDWADEVELDGLILRHQPRPGPCPGEIAGHLHPVARVVGRGASVRRRCFLGDGARVVMPAFGAYAGGLNVRDPAYDALFQSASRLVHVLGRERVYAVASTRCLGE